MDRAAVKERARQSIDTVFDAIEKLESKKENISTEAAVKSEPRNWGFERQKEGAWGEIQGARNGFKRKVGSGKSRFHGQLGILQKRRWQTCADLALALLWKNWAKPCNRVVGLFYADVRHVLTVPKWLILIQIQEPWKTVSPGGAGFSSVCSWLCTDWINFFIFYPLAMAVCRMRRAISLMRCTCTCPFYTCSKSS